VTGASTHTDSERCTIHRWPQAVARPSAARGRAITIGDGAILVCVHATGINTIDGEVWDSYRGADSVPLCWLKGRPTRSATMGSASQRVVGITQRELCAPITRHVGLAM